MVVVFLERLYRATGTDLDWSAGLAAPPGWQAWDGYFGGSERSSEGGMVTTPSSSEL